jgi:hypothetical protein
MSKHIPNEFIDLLVKRYKEHKIECNAYFYNKKRFIYFSNLDTVKPDWTIRLNLDTLKIQAFYEPAKYGGVKIDYKEILWHTKNNKYLLEYIEKFVTEKE